MEENWEETYIEMLDNLIDITWKIKDKKISKDIREGCIELIDILCQI